MTDIKALMSLEHIPVVSWALFSQSTLRVVVDPRGLKHVLIGSHPAFAIQTCRAHLFHLALLLHDLFVTSFSASHDMICSTVNTVRTLVRTNLYVKSLQTGTAAKMRGCIHI